MNYKAGLALLSLGAALGAGVTTCVNKKDEIKEFFVSNPNKEIGDTLKISYQKQAEKIDNEELEKIQELSNQKWDVDGVKIIQKNVLNPYFPGNYLDHPVISIPYTDNLYIDANGKVLSDGQYRYIYDENNRIKYEVAVSTSTGLEFASLRNTYNKDGKLEKIDRFFKDGKIFESCVLKYSDNDRIVKAISQKTGEMKGISLRDANGHEVAYITEGADISYDKNGRPTKWDGIKYLYNENGFLSEVRYTNAKFLLEYDNNGNVSKSKYIKDGNSVQYYYEYDTNNKLIDAGEMVRQ